MYSDTDRMNWLASQEDINVMRMGKDVVRIDLCPADEGSMMTIEGDSLRSVVDLQLAKVGWVSAAEECECRR